MIRDIRKNEQRSQAPLIQPKADVIIGNGKTVVKKFIHGGMLEKGMLDLSGIIAEMDRSGHQFVQYIPFNPGEGVIVFHRA